MFVKIEPSGCGERKGMVEVRLAFYLDPADYGYDKHYIQLPDFTGQEYEGKLDKDGMPVDIEDYIKWVDSLPKIWQHNPFHNHFIQVPPETTDKEIMDKAEILCKQAYQLWQTDECKKMTNPLIKWPEKTPALVTACDNRVADIVSKELIREVK